jgi:hypothetical protein
MFSIWVFPGSSFSEVKTHLEPELGGLSASLNHTWPPSGTTTVTVAAAGNEATGGEGGGDIVVGLVGIEVGSMVVV